MRKHFKKYSLLGLSLMLILSNFSFATQHMLCLMNEDNDVKCECKCDIPAPSNMLIITNEDSPCCQSNIIELSNNNNLQIYNKELPSDITSFSPSITVSDVEVTLNNINNPFSPLTNHVPRKSIPILISSLRI